MAIQKVRHWAYRIWTGKTGKPCVTLSRDGSKLEKLIQEHGELVVAVAWALYVHSDDYFLEPRELATECTTKKGDKYIQTAQDSSLTVRFPLAAFLNVPDGYIFAAQDIVLDEAGRKAHYAFRAVAEACKTQLKRERTQDTSR
jgi:hypothetical protein